MTLLDQNKLHFLEKNFTAFSQGVNLLQFIKLMIKVIQVLPEDRFEFIYGLRKLFLDIDINGDKFLEWSEFTQYIIDTVISSSGNMISLGRFFLT